MENRANEENSEKKTIIERMNIFFSKTAEEELSDEIAVDDIAASVFLIVVNGIFGLAFIAHQTGSTGFFTSKFSTFEMIMLYGTLIYWITTSVLILLGQKHPSRDLDTYGGLFFATFAIGWLILVFPFDFTYFADVLPVFLRFLLQWISNEIALVLLVLLLVVHLIFGVVSLIIRLYVFKARAVINGEKNEE
ncbi:MAG: hypothetical protein JSW11_01425 [Candidatus Heimdallarchaeota archaeon]|nr:MAG: hypothetical protein JSW11_01425 [Candidatus Heimdallarchaeota archaeon]